MRHSRLRTRFKSDISFRWLATFSIGLSLLNAFSDRLLAGVSQPVPTHQLIVGWDDAVICCGPGTDAGMDSPQAVERMVKRWKARGIQGVYWRVDEAMLPERFMTRWKPKVSPSQNYLLERVDQTLVKFPLIKTLLGAAKREGVEIWAWYPTIYGNGAPPTGPGFTQAWLYENKFGTDHPEILSVDRAGTCLGNWRLDWKTWINEGLVNELVVPVVLDGYEGYGASAKPADFGYLEGAVSVETARTFIKQSR